MISANIATIILPTRTVRVLDMQSPRLLLHRQPLEVGNLELDLIKGVDQSPTLQGNAGRGYDCQRPRRSRAFHSHWPSFTAAVLRAAETMKETSRELKPRWVRTFIR